jgi:hypothetical protein
MSFTKPQSEHKVKNHLMTVINNPTASQHKMKKLPVSNFFFDNGD